jgi:hypothetical protein
MQGGTLFRLTKNLGHGWAINDMKKAYIAVSLGITGAAGRNRTGDLRITNALLYQLSYSGCAILHESTGSAF